MYLFCSCSSFCSCVFDLIKFNFHIYWDTKIVSWFRQCKMLMYLIPFHGLLKKLNKEHHFIMPIINENTLIIKNDKCKKNRKNPRNTPKSGIISKYIFSTNGFMDIVEQKIPPSPFFRCSWMYVIISEIIFNQKIANFSKFVVNYILLHKWKCHIIHDYLPINETIGIKLIVLSRTLPEWKKTSEMKLLFE